MAVLEVRLVQHFLVQHTTVVLVDERTTTLNFRGDILKGIMKLCEKLNVKLLGEVCEECLNMTPVNCTPKTLCRNKVEGTTPDNTVIKLNGSMIYSIYVYDICVSYIVNK